MRDRLTSRMVGSVIVLASLTAAAGAAAQQGAQAAAAPPPVVAGFFRLKDDPKNGSAPAGELLLAELNCTACHKPEGEAASARLAPKGAPDLSDVGSRVTPQWIRAYLTSPHGVKPGATMPDIFHASDPAARDGAVEFLIHYLVSLGGPIQPPSRGGNDLLVRRGRELYHTVGCVACHEPDFAKGERAATPKVPSVPLGDLASKTTVEQLTQFLLDPLKTRPHGRMPFSNLTSEEAESIAVYLLRAQLANSQSAAAEPARERGVKFSYYEGEFQNVAVERLERLKPKAEGIAPKFTINVPERKANDNFALKFAGAVKVPRDGHYTFTTRSDDGSRLYLDGKQLVLNDGVHPESEKSASVDLKAGEHPIVVTYFQGGGEESLKVEWQGPELPRQELPTDVLVSVGGRPMVPLKTETFTVDPQKAQMGRQMFAVLGCASCHQLKGVEPMRPAKTLAAINVNSPEGCLGDHVRKGIPQYHLSEPQRDSLRAALKDRAALARELEPAQRVTRALAAMNCYACHERDGLGGPDASRVEHFVMTASFDMGDEGKLPPRLSHVGAKLRPEAMEKIITAGELHVRRHHMATRMPRFPMDRVALLIEDFAAADGASNDAGPAFTELVARDGRTLTGTKGMGCVNCHGVGDAKSLGMPSVNLSAEYQRLQWPWFRQLLLDPARVNPGTRMPAFWMDGHIVYPNLGGGTVDGQIAAIWTYMSLGATMPLPAGVRPEGAGLELIPIDEPIVHRTFMADIGPRAIAVGFPDGVHVAFDANAVRLAKAWKGRFFDAKGMWEGRGGAAYGPLGRDVINLPLGPAVALLAAPDAPWPVPQARRQRNVGGEFKGYCLDKQRQPIFTYRLGDVTIDEQPLPVLTAGGVVLVRKFHVSGPAPAAGKLYLLAAAGAKVSESSPGTWRVDDKLNVHVTAPAGTKPELRERGIAKQVLVPIELKEGKPADVEIEVAW